MSAPLGATEAALLHDLTALASTAAYLAEKCGEIQARLFAGERE